MNRPRYTLSRHTLLRAVAAKYAGPLFAFFGMPAEHLSNAQIATWVALTWPDLHSTMKRWLA